MTSRHPSKITKWPHIIIIPLVGRPKPRTKSINSPTHPGTEKSGAKVVILGDLIKKIRKCIPTVLAVAISQNYPKAPKKNTIHPDFWMRDPLWKYLIALYERNAWKRKWNSLFGTEADLTSNFVVVLLSTFWVVWCGLKW